MLIRCISSESRKLRHSLILPACILIPVIPAIMGTFNYLQNQGILSADWYSLWTQNTLFYACLFYAPLIALYCSYLWRLEHRHNNWNMIMTAPVPVSGIFFAKLSVIILITLFTQLWMGILYILCGKLTGLPGFCPPEIVFWLIRGTLGAVPICALQLLLSMKIRSFSIPIGIALVGSIAGMMIVNMDLGLICPYSLMFLGMNSNQTEDSLSGNFLPFLAAVLIFSAIFCFASVWLLKHRDVRS
ncbi:MAG TPA: ABC transporter permease [Candidatus Blautia faecipullorum]|nr:ABC transporter permease [Candidatus Blautia faecipullorum]